MNIKIIGNYIGHILRLEGLFMLPALVIALFCREFNAAAAFGISMALVVIIGFVLIFIRPANKNFYAREGFITVALSWIFISFFGALPFRLSGAVPNFLDCFFETVSGFTTTGASILTDVEAMPLSLLYWRSFSHWLGGMGVLVFMLAVLPLGSGDGGGGALKVLRAESPGPVFGKFVPKLSYTARILYGIYIVMTILEFILLLCGGMPAFDSLLNSFATAGTGGFAIKNASMGAYDSCYLQGVIAVFMVLFGINFNMYYFLLIRDFRSIIKSDELRLYIGVIIGATAAIAINILPQFDNLFAAFHHSFFQVSSIITTTGFASIDYNTWPELSRCILLLITVIGASAGSTGGGIKIARVLILIKTLRNSLQKMIHPRSVKKVKLDGDPIDDSIIREVSVFMAAYLIILCASVIIISLDNKSFETTFSAVLACMNNIGPGLGECGPAGNYSGFSYLSKFILTADMLIGRLEIFPMLLLFSPSVWIKGK